MHLRGYQTAVAILFVKTVRDTPEGVLRITASCLAIGSGFEDSRQVLSPRPPPSHLVRWGDFGDDGEASDV